MMIEAGHRHHGRIDRQAGREHDPGDRIQLLRENRIGTVGIDVQFFRQLPADLVISQRGHGRVGRLTGGCSASEGIRGGRSYVSHSETDAAKKTPNPAGQSGYRIHRMDNHVCCVRNRAFRALGQRVGKYAGLTYVLEICDRGYLGETYLEHIEAFHPIGPRVALKYRGVGDDGVLAHRAVSRHLLLDVKSGA